MHPIYLVSFHCDEKSSLWQSQGALRFLLLKRAMDLVYASIGTAIQVTGSESNSGVWMPVAAAAASYYAITGPDATASRVAKVMSSSSFDLIRRVSQVFVLKLFFIVFFFFFLYTKSQLLNFMSWSCLSRHGEWYHYQQ